MPKACTKCGTCCENITLVLSKRQVMNRLTKSVAEKHEGDILEMSMLLRCFIWNKKRSDGQWECSCRYYRASSNGYRAKCLIYAGRPFICSNYPYGRGALEKECGYKVKKPSGEIGEKEGAK